MPENDDKGWKPSGAATAALIGGALALAAGTCWLAKINPLPTTGHWSKDPGWFLTFVLVYFFVLYFAVERLRRRR